MNYAILDGHEVKACTMPEWAVWFEQNATTGRIVRKTVISEAPDILVSTVFLGMNHQWGKGRPLWFETMVFCEPGSGYESDMGRYTTWEEAEEGHAAMVAKWEEICGTGEEPDDLAGADIPDDHEQ